METLNWKSHVSMKNNIEITHGMNVLNHTHLFSHESTEAGSFNFIQNHSVHLYPMTIILVLLEAQRSFLNFSTIIIADSYTCMHVSIIDTTNQEKTGHYSDQLTSLCSEMNYDIHLNTNTKIVVLNRPLKPTCHARRFNRSLWPGVRMWSCSLTSQLLWKVKQCTSRTRLSNNFYL